MNYTELEEQSKKRGETRDCTVKAFSVVTGFNYEASHKEMAAAGRTPREGLRSDFFHYNNKMLEQLVKNGFKVSKVKCNSKTVRTLGRKIKSNGNFLVFTRGHVLAIKDRKVVDWTEGRCHRIKSVWKIEK